MVPRTRVVFRLFEGHFEALCEGTERQRNYPVLPKCDSCNRVHTGVMGLDMLLRVGKLSLRDRVSVSVSVRHLHRTPGAIRELPFALPKPVRGGIGVMWPKMLLYGEWGMSPKVVIVLRERLSLLHSPPATCCEPAVRLESHELAWATEFALGGALGVALQVRSSILFCFSRKCQLQFCTLCMQNSHRDAPP